MTQSFETGGWQQPETPKQFLLQQLESALRLGTRQVVRFLGSDAQGGLAGSGDVMLYEVCSAPLAVNFLKQLCDAGYSSKEPAFFDLLQPTARMLPTVQELLLCELFAAAAVGSSAVIHYCGPYSADDTAEDFLLLDLPQRMAARAGVRIYERCRMADGSECLLLVKARS